MNEKSLPLFSQIKFGLKYNIPQLFSDKEGEVRSSIGSSFFTSCVGGEIWA